MEEKKIKELCIRADEYFYNKGLISEKEYTILKLAKTIYDNNINSGIHKYYNKKFIFKKLDMSVIILYGDLTYVINYTSFNSLKKHLKNIIYN